MEDLKLMADTDSLPQQVKITSSGDQLPAGVKLPGAYSATDPGIQVDIWGSDFKSYTIPGPEVIDASFF